MLVAQVGSKIHDMTKHFQRGSDGVHNPALAVKNSFPKAVLLNIHVTWFLFSDVQYTVHYFVHLFSGLDRLGNTQYILWLTNLWFYGFLSHRRSIKQN